MFDTGYNSGLGSFYAAMLPPVHAAEAAVDPAVAAAAAVAAAYADGLATGEAHAVAAMAVERDLLRSLQASLTAALRIDVEALGPAFVALVTTLAEAVVMAELALSPMIVAQLVADALGSLVIEPGISVRLHPDDIAAVADSCPVPVIAAPELARGSIAVVGPDFVVLDGLAARLTAMAAALSSASHSPGRFPTPHPVAPAQAGAHVDAAARAMPEMGPSLRWGDGVAVADVTMPDTDRV